MPRIAECKAKTTSRSERPYMGIFMDYETETKRPVQPKQATLLGLTAARGGLAEALTAQRKAAESRMASLDALDDKLVRSGLPLTVGGD